MADITVRSTRFEDDGEIPGVHAHPSAGGDNTSPDLSWDGVPEGTKSVAVTCWDPDAPTTVGFTHWMRVGIAPDVRSLEAGAGQGGDLGADGLTDWGETGYGGMAPPAGDDPHHYRFTVYALDQAAGDLGLDDHATYAKFKFLTRSHVLATGTITGRFSVAG